MVSTHTPWLTLLLFSLRSGVVLAACIEGYLLASPLWSKRAQPTKASLKGRAFSNFLREWAHRQEAK